MPDRSIAFYNVILRCDRYEPLDIRLPRGFYFRGFEDGDERAWAELEHEIGDFASRQEAQQYFVSTYCGEVEALKSRCVFVANDQGKVVGSCMAWRDRRGTEDVASLHWLVVAPDYQGRQIGKALCRKTMELFREREEFPVYIHTQPWSYPAILLYVRQGFKLQKSDTFSDYHNQYTQAMETLRGILTQQQYRELLLHSEE